MLKLVLSQFVGSPRSFEVALVDTARPGELVGWTREAIAEADALAVRAAGLRVHERLAVSRPVGGLGARSYRVRGEPPRPREHSSAALYSRAD